MSTKVEDVNIEDMVIVIDRPTKKKFVGEVTAKHKSRITISKVSPEGDEEELDLTIDRDTRILANLGNKAPPGTVYGCQIRKLYSTLDHPFWGHIAIMRNMADDEKEALKVALKSSVKRLTATGLSNTIELTGFIVGEPKGKYAGKYKGSRNGNYIYLNPKVLDESNAKYIVDHELAHAIWHQVLNDETQSKWVHLFTKFTSMVSIPEEPLAEVIEVISNCSGFIDEYHEAVEDIEYGAEWLDTLINSLLSIHLFDKRDLDLYLWSLSPKKRRRELEQASLNLVQCYGEHNEYPVSEYGTTNVSELFAEAYAFYVNGMSMHQDAVELLEQTIPNIVALKRKRCK